METRLFPLAWQDGNLHLVPARRGAAGVEPGFNDARLPGRTHPHVVPRRNGATYRESWEAAIAGRAQWITVSTWNEWFEGNMIAPGRGYGTRYLSLAATHARRWRSS